MIKEKGIILTKKQYEELCKDLAPYLAMGKTEFCFKVLDNENGYCEHLEIKHEIDINKNFNKITELFEINDKRKKLIISKMNTTQEQAKILSKFTTKLIEKINIYNLEENGDLTSYITLLEKGYFYFEIRIDDLNFNNIKLNRAVLN